MNPTSTRTLIGHSYGSTVVATAARNHTLDLDALVGVASPGMRVSSADDLQLPVDGRVYAVTDTSGGKLNPFDGDPIHTISDGILTMRLGGDPTRSGFGAESFAVGDAGGHSLSGYIDPAPGSVAGTNFGYLVTGQFDRLE
ncbi:MAG: alpha/beta hydrolase [Nitriliruptor sp.]|uniref:alpha/beta hydrolase n=1 Tax=Nitriliruptor sp. TaxID=2448056 RepID=UPI0034A08F3D